MFGIFLAFYLSLASPMGNPAGVYYPGQVSTFDGSGEQGPINPPPPPPPPHP